MAVGMCAHQLAAGGLARAARLHERERLRLRVLPALEVHGHAHHGVHVVLEQRLDGPALRAHQLLDLRARGAAILALHRQQQVRQLAHVVLRRHSRSMCLSRRLQACCGTAQHAVTSGSMTCRCPEHIRMEQCTFQTLT